MDVLGLVVGEPVKLSSTRDFVQTARRLAPVALIEHQPVKALQHRPVLDKVEQDLLLRLVSHPFEALLRLQNFVDVSL